MTKGRPTFGTAFLFSSILLQQKSVNVFLRYAISVGSPWSQ